MLDQLLRIFGLCGILCDAVCLQDIWAVVGSAKAIAELKDHWYWCMKKTLLRQQMIKV